jgi:hypothetical protein
VTERVPELVSDGRVLGDSDASRDEPPADHDGARSVSAYLSLGATFLNGTPHGTRDVDSPSSGSRCSAVAASSRSPEPCSSALRPERESPSSTDSPDPVPIRTRFADERTPPGGA